MVANSRWFSRIGGYAAQLYVEHNDRKGLSREIGYQRDALRIDVDSGIYLLARGVLVGALAGRISPV